MLKGGGGGNGNEDITYDEEYEGNYDKESWKILVEYNVDIFVFNRFRRRKVDMHGSRVG